MRLISDWLDQLGSHELYPDDILHDIHPQIIYDAELGMLQCTRIGVMARIRRGSFFCSGNLQSITRWTPAQAILATPEGVVLNPDAERQDFLCAGYTIAEDLHRLLVAAEDPPSATLTDRGDKYRADLASLIERGW